MPTVFKPIRLGPDAHSYFANSFNPDVVQPRTNSHSNTSSKVPHLLPIIVHIFLTL